MTEKMLTRPDGSQMPASEFDPQTMILGGPWPYLMGQRITPEGFDLLIREGFTVLYPVVLGDDCIALQRGEDGFLIGITRPLEVLLAHQDCEAAA